MMLLKDYKPENTLGIAGLSTQLCNQAVKLGFLTKVEHPNITLDQDSLVHLYLQPAAASSLLKVATTNQIKISTAYRTLAQQFILKQNLQTLVANVGSSDHGSGRSIDTTNYDETKDAFIKAGWKFPYASDPVHADYPGSDQRSNTVLTFQKLWNLNQPDKLVEDGSCGPKVLAALRVSPCAGFPIAATTRIPLASGDIGQDVGRLQLKLKALGYFTGSCNMILGLDTKAAVIKAQETLGLQADGIAGSLTLERLGLLGSTTQH
jgi:Putative peptidoglycan binding domain